MLSNYSFDGQTWIRPTGTPFRESFEIWLSSGILMSAVFLKKKTIVLRSSPDTRIEEL